MSGLAAWPFSDEWIFPAISGAISLITFVLKSASQVYKRLDEIKNIFVVTESDKNAATSNLISI